jgi:hypothetical protein
VSVIPKALRRGAFLAFTSLLLECRSIAPIVGCVGTFDGEAELIVRDPLP